MDSKKEVNRVISELKSAGTIRASCSSSLYGALIMMRTTLIKTRQVQVQLIHAGCIPLLLDLLTPPITKGNWLKTVDIVISILANMCLEEEAREQVIASKGLSIIVEATKCTEKESIHNRGVRAVANLIQHSSKSDAICDEVFDLEFHIFVAKRLMEAKEKECKQTYLRAIRLFGQRKSQLIKLIDDSRSVQAVAFVLKDGDEKLKHKSLRILHEFSALRCCINFVEQILAANILEDLVQAAENADDEISSLSLSIILKLCEHENIRPPLGAAGLIPTLMRLLDCERSHVNHVSLMNALCLCCFEAVNRHRLYQEKTLELFMSTLNSEQNESGKFSVLQDRILSCLVCFLYNDECFDKLLDLKLVSVVIGHLSRVCHLQMPDGDWNKEVEMILNEKKFGVKESCSDEYDDDETSNEKDNKNGNNPTTASLSEQVNVIEEVRDCDLDVNSTPDHLDQEIIDISMDDTEIIPPSGTQDSRHIFSIDSPTYQMEQHSWRLEDHTSGITCKNYSEDPHQDEIINPKSVPEGGGFVKFSPYSPLSAGSSYYSPAYPSPAHSCGSSPRHSNFQTGSFHLGSMSPRSSPSSSVHSEDTWSSSDPAGRSPSNIMLSPNFHHGQFSPLINPYPASPPPFSMEDRNISENPLYNSQVSNASNRSVDSQEDIFSEFTKPLFSQETLQGTSRFSSLSEAQHGESQKPVYSASEEEDEDSDNPTDLNKLCNEESVKSSKIEDTRIPNDKAKSMSDTSSMEKLTKGKKITKTSSFEPSTRSIKSPEIGIEDENAMFPLSLTSATNVPFVRLNSEPYFSIPSPNINSLEKHNSDEQPSRKIKQSEEDVSSSSRSLSVKLPSIKSGKRLFSKQCSFPGRASLSSVGNRSPHSPSCSSSPYRVQFDLPFNSPSMSPFSRYSNSPYASPNPYHSRAEKLYSACEASSEGVSKRDNNSYEKKSQSADKTSIHSFMPSQPSLSTSFQENSPRTFSKNPTSHQPSTTKSSKEKDTDNDRLNRIKRKTEENILVLMSRISVKTDPSPHLPKYAILYILTKYIAVVPNPLQRCIRTLFRVFQSPHCFESVLLEQAPALIVKNLIMDQDGKLPSVLFKDQQENKPIVSQTNTNREINFDEIFASSQSSETPSDFELKIQFEFGGDAYSDMMHHQRSFRSDILQPNFLFRGKSMSHFATRDSSYLYSSMTPEDLIRVRIRSGMNLMKAITSLAFSRYGDGEIKRIWSRGTESQKLMSAISLLHMPIGCGPLHRRQIILKHDAFHRVIPLLFCTEAPLVRESIVTALSLLAHLFRIKKVTPKICKLTNSFPESTPCSRLDNSTECEMSGEGNASANLSDKGSQNMKANVFTCKFEHISDKFNLNLIVHDNSSQKKKVFRACKEILMKNSDVFSAMFGGSYAEADKVDIEFSDVDLSGFEYILHFLHGCESGCAVIDWLSLVDSNVVNDCDKDCGLDTKDSLKNGEFSLNKSPSKQVMFAGKAEGSSLESDQCDDTLPKDSIVIEDDTSLEKKFEESPHSSDLLEKSKLSAVKTSRENESDDNQITKQIDFILDKSMDIITVADRFLVHDLVEYLTSVLSHTCLYTRTISEIIHLASTYKLTGLVTDCIVEVLLSHTSGKDKAALFQMLGVELDCDVKKMLIDILTDLFIAKAEGS